MPFFISKTIYIDVSQKRHCGINPIVVNAGDDVSSSSLDFLGYPTNNPEPVELFEGDYQVLRFHLIDQNGDYVSLQEQGDFYLNISSDHATELLACYNSSFNKDWDEANPLDGKVSCRLDLAQPTFATALGAEEEITVWVELWYRPINMQWQLITQIPAKLINSASGYDSSSSSGA